MKPSDTCEQLPTLDPIGAETEKSESGIGAQSIPEPNEGEISCTSDFDHTQHEAQGTPAKSVGNRLPSLRLASVNQVAEMPEYKCFSKSSLRHLIFQADPRVNSLGEEIPGNGLSPAIIKISRRVLLDLDEFDRWIANHRQAPLLGICLCLLINLQFPAFL